MNQLLAIPLELRLAVLFVLGTLVGSAVNLAVFTLRFPPRPISPWSREHPRDAASRWLDRVPLLGWWRLRRRVAMFGPRFWIRPLAIEALFGFGFAALYVWEIRDLGLVARLLPAGAMLAPTDLLRLHAVYAAHLLLIALMAAASVIDLDDQTIPDHITVPGTLLGLALAALVPWSLMPVVIKGALPPAGAGAVGPITFTLDFFTLVSPNPWPAGLLGGKPGALVLGLGCYWLWCVGLLPRRWQGRRGWRKALQVVLARMTREFTSTFMLLLSLVGSAFILAVWWKGGDAWRGLLTALVGMAAGGGLVWAVRVIGGWALNKEAMGFGDVTLMAMLGTFLGWQMCLMVFFLAPFAALLVGLVQLVLYRDNVVPYGPFLCLAALGAMLNWGALWEWAAGLFALGWLVPVVVVFCLVLLGVLLPLCRLVLDLFRRGDD